MAHGRVGAARRTWWERAYGLGHAAVNARYLLAILKNKPQVAVRLARNYANVLRNPGRPPLRLVDVALTYVCNMRCKHCSATELQDPEREVLTPAQYRIVADRLAAAGAVLINFTGGDPFMRKDFAEVVRAFGPERFILAVVTNGLAADRQKLRDLRRLGIDSIHVSIDAPSASAHDTFRNSPGAFQHAVEVLGWAKEEGLQIGVSYSLTHSNLHSEERRSMEELTRRFGAMLNYNLAVPIGFWKGQFEDLFQPGDRAALTRYLDAYPQSKTDFETNYFRRGCGAMKEKLYVTAYGDVMPCPFIQVRFGNILTEGVDTIRARAFEYTAFADYAPHCLAAEDMSFIRGTVCYSADAGKLRLPVWHEDAFTDRDAMLVRRSVV